MYRLVFLLLPLTFIMKFIAFNYSIVWELACERIVDYAKPSLKEDKDNYDTEYPWEFKTIIYNKNDFKELYSRKSLWGVTKEPDQLYMEFNESMFFNFIPYSNKKDGKFMMTPIFKKNIEKLQDLISNEHIIIKSITQKEKLDLTDDNLFLQNETGEKLHWFDVSGSLKNYRVCRVTYVLYKEYDIWVPSFVTYDENEFFNVYYNFSATGSDSKDVSVIYTNKTSSNFYEDEIVEKQTGIKYVLITEDIEIGVGKISRFDDFVTNGEFEPTEMEKEKAKQAFAKYKGKKTVWDENPDGTKFRTWVTQEGKALLHLKVKNPKFPYLENEL
jgi:hypothetical protein